MQPNPPMTVKLILDILQGLEALQKRPETKHCVPGNPNSGSQFLHLYFK